MMSVRPLRGPTLYVLDQHGPDALASLCEGLAIRTDTLLDPAKWIELANAVTFLARVRALVSDEDEFVRICAHRFREGFGPMVHVLPATTPRLMFDVACKTIPLFSNVSRGEVVRESRTEVVMRYYSDAPELETRELCLTRKAAMVGIPTIFGLPEALIHETSCIANGDAHCEYASRFYTRVRWVPPAVGILAGGAVAFGLMQTGMNPHFAYLTFPALFGLLGAVFEMRGTQRANLAYAENIQESLRELALHEGEARREIVAFHQRQKEWGKLMEEQVAEWIASQAKVSDVQRGFQEVVAPNAGAAA